MCDRLSSAHRLPSVNLFSEAFHILGEDRLGIFTRAAQFK
jgi:hypothetical protein